MTDYNKATGNAGTMIIRDTGTTVEFHLACSDPATNLYNLAWSGVVNGQAVGGTVSTSPGFGSKYLGGWTVSSAQTVTFHINASGTSGIGGPTDHSAAIPRGPAATIPAAPNAPTATGVSATTIDLAWTLNGDGGSPIDATVLRWTTNPDVNAPGYFQLGLPADARSYSLGPLEPGTTYYFQVYARNAVGYSPGSGVLTQATLAGVYVSDGTTWKPAEVFVSDGTTYKRADLLVSNGTAWKPAG